MEGAVFVLLPTSMSLYIPGIPEFGRSSSSCKIGFVFGISAVMGTGALLTLYVRFHHASTGSLGVALLEVTGASPFLPGFWGMSVRTTADKFGALVLLFCLYHARNFKRSPFD
jgi:hypothetical protein